VPLFWNHSDDHDLDEANHLFLVNQAQEVQRFGLPPKVAFLSHSSFGSSKRASAKKMRAARDLFVAQHPEIECDGELHGDAALQPEIRAAYLGDSTLSGAANLLVCPNVDAANILYNVLKTIASGGVTVGPMLMGVNGTAYILTPAATVYFAPFMLAVSLAGILGFVAVLGVYWAWFSVRVHRMRILL